MADEISTLMNKSKEKTFACHKCEEAFSTLRLLGNHLSSFHGKNTKCEYCSYSNNTFHKMIQHEKNCKFQKEEFNCHKCGNDC